ncbi:sialoadhesin-like [Puntigrus tetrazona]|uniref:sialoadhesin-like n=1 Tax=Puntigrus tetrazona TaxID=1606681 RepID=UPI001C89E2B2|nr:sialoadhesin-like [Puntigrus tetrazona]
MELRQLPFVFFLISNISFGRADERPKPKVSIKPDQHVLRGDTVTLRCDIDAEGVTIWKYSWYKDGSVSVFSEGQEHTFSSVTESDEGKYSCYGAEREGSRTSIISDEVTLTVSDKAQTVLSVSPQKWLTEGDPVTLICEVKGSSTGWTFSWYTQTVFTDNSHHYHLLSDSSRGAGGNYTVSSAALKHTGVYVCRAERGKPAYNTTFSNTQPLWVIGVSPPVSLIISPNRTQHFTLVSLSLSCEDQSNSDRWTVRRYTDSGHLEDCSSSHWGRQTGSKCKISPTVPSDTGVYWCQSEYGDSYNIVNITVHTGVILESPVHPVTEGDSLTLRCLYTYISPPNLRADFYKDGSLIQSQTTEMIISNVSKSHEGFYYCKHPERGESPKSWISVRGVSSESCCIYSHSGSQISVLHTLSSVLAVCPYLLVTVVLIFKCCRMRGTSVEEKETSLNVHRRLSDSEMRPDQHVFRRETVTLRCDIDAEGVTIWKYSWYKDGSVSVFSEGQEHTFRSVTESDEGKYSCYGAEREGSRTSIISDEVTLTVSDKAQTVLSVSPQKWLTEGDPVTLICEVKGSSTGWTFSWFTLFHQQQTATVGHWSQEVLRLYDSLSLTVCHHSVSMELSQLPLVLLLISSINSGRTEETPKPKVSIKPDQHVFRRDTVTLRCDIDAEGVTRWKYRWYKDGSVIVFSKLQEHTFRSVTESDEGKYSCYGAEREGSLRSQISDEVTLIVSDLPKPTVIVEPQSSVFTGDSVTLRCEVNQTWVRWEFLWIKDSNTQLTDTATKTIDSVKVSDGGEYTCRARREGYYTHFSEPVTLTIYERPKAKVSIKPDQHVFRGETVTLRCDIDAEGVTIWKYSWYKDGSVSVFSEGQEHTFRSVTESDEGKYSCYGAEREGSRTSIISDEVTLTVSDLRAVLSVSPQKWLTEGDPVTLICEVKGSSAGWTFSWYTVIISSDYSSNHYKLLSDSSRGAGGNYTVSSAALKHTGVYVCKAERRKSVYYKTISNTQPLWVNAVSSSSGVSPPVSLIISPNRTQHFTSVSLSLSCEDQSNSDRWTVRRYTNSWGLEDCSSSVWGSQTGSSCKISSTTASDTGVYWCQSESGENSHPVNITVHFFVILESPVHPVTEGDSLTLRCLYPYISQPNLRADFYKDGSLIQTQTTEMIISNVSKSHEGFYYCKHPERGESPKSWISVRAGVILESPVHPVTEGDSLTLRCLYQRSTPPDLRADFYKEGSLIQSQTTEMIISDVSKSHEGFYYSMLTLKDSLANCLCCTLVIWTQCETLYKTL